MSWEMRCRDGKPRHIYPYSNKGDAAFDAKCYDKDEEPCGPGCVGGPHTVHETGAPFGSDVVDEGVVEA